MISFFFQKMDNFVLKRSEMQDSGSKKRDRSPERRTSEPIVVSDDEPLVCSGASPQEESQSRVKEFENWLSAIAK